MACCSAHESSCKAACRGQDGALVLPLPLPCASAPAQGEAINLSPLLGHSVLLLLCRPSPQEPLQLHVPRGRPAGCGRGAPGSGAAEGERAQELQEPGYVGARVCRSQEMQGSGYAGARKLRDSEVPGPGASGNSIFPEIPEPGNSGARRVRGQEVQGPGNAGGPPDLVLPAVYGSPWSVLGCTLPGNDDVAFFTSFPVPQGARSSGSLLMPTRGRAVRRGFLPHLWCLSPLVRLWWCFCVLLCACACSTSRPSSLSSGCS